MRTLIKTLASAFLISSIGCQDRQPRAENVTTYYVDVNLRQTHFSLDPNTHMTDELNEITFTLPTAKPRYTQLKTGDNLVDAFRSASLLLNGTIGDTQLSVDHIPSVVATADTTSYRVGFELKQSHFTLDPITHLKDKMNKVTFDWDVPGDVYKELSVGDDLIKDGFRSGSLLFKGNAGSWHLKVAAKKGPTPR